MKKHWSLIAFALAMWAVAPTMQAEEPEVKNSVILPYQNPNLSAVERAKDLVSRLTLEEKVSLMCDQSDAVPRLGIPEFQWWSEALHGYANIDDVTVFPEPVAMAASFDDELLYHIFDAVSDEARARYQQLKIEGKIERFHHLSVWTPNVNIFRDPRWGRGQETYGEDPYLTSKMGTAVVKGLQGDEKSKYRKLLACAKHYAVHSGPEYTRHSANLDHVSPRDLWETYMPAFKVLVEDAHVRQVMCAYQRFDNEPCCGSTRLLQQILRNDWNYKYMIVSDCGAIADFYTSHKVSADAVSAAAKGVLAGTDVECQWNDYNYKKLPEAVRQGLLSEADIDVRLLRVLEARFELGDMDDDDLVPYTKIPLSVVNNEEHRQLSLSMAKESMVLLQNNNDILPLNKNQKIALVGPNAADSTMLWGNYNGTPIRTISILDGFKSKVGADHLIYDKACDLVEDKVTESYFSKCGWNGQKGFYATYWNNKDMEGTAVVSQQLENPIKLTTAGQHEFAPGVLLEGFSGKFFTQYIADKTEELVFKCGATGYFELIVNDSTYAVYRNWRTLPSRFLFPVEAGKSYNIEIRYAQLNNWQANLEFDFGKEQDVDFDALIHKVKDVDVVVFVGGLSSKLEGEEMPVSYPGFKGGDRTNIELCGIQRKCIEALHKAGKKIVFVNCSGSAIAMTPESQRCDAILQAWYGGESGGQAVADILFGDYNPSGRLPITFYKSQEQLPDYEDYSMKGRTYRYMQDALFPFGFGLSYTTFEVGAAKINKTKLKIGETAQLTIPLTNTGRREGAELIQVYVRRTDDVDGPLKSLRAYKKISLKAQQSSKVVIDLPSSTFECFDENSNTMRVMPGEYDLFYGTSSKDDDLKCVRVLLQ